MRQPFLQGEHVYLRTIEEGDLNERYRDWFNDEEVCRFNSHHRFPNYDENMREYYERVIKSHANLVLAICSVGTDSHIGNITLLNIDHINRSAELAILIGDRAFWGKGVGTEAARLIILHGFKELNLHRIYFGTSEDNAGMQKLGLHLGFREEGRARDGIFKNGAFKNVIYYSLLGNEFAA